MRSSLTEFHKRILKHSKWKCNANQDIELYLRQYPGAESASSSMKKETRKPTKHARSSSFSFCERENFTATVVDLIVLGLAREIECNALLPRNKPWARNQPNRCPNNSNPRKASAPRVKARFVQNSTQQQASVLPRRLLRNGANKPGKTFL